MRRRRIPCTDLRLRVPWPLQNELVSSWESGADVVGCILASLHLPWVVDGRIVSRWRGRYYLDGCFTNHNPTLDENTCRVYPLLWRSPLFWSRHGCFSVPTTRQVEQDFAWGYEDAKAHFEYFSAHGLRARPGRCQGEIIE
jgi:hypothetical protein